jgi:hypothetical protein
MAANKEASRIASTPAAFIKMQESIRDLGTEQKKENKENKQKDRKDRLNTRGQAATRAGYSGLGGFLQGRAGEKISGMGLRGSIGNLAGRAVGAGGSGLSRFSKIGGGPGMMGMTASFMLPMLAGQIGPKESRVDRAGFSDGDFRIQRGGAAETASSTLMGAGMGALLGLPGLIVGAGMGFIHASKKMTLSIKEMVEFKEKEINVISRNLQATSQIQALTDQRAAAFKTGDSRAVNNIDAAINQSLAQISDPEILSRAAGAAGNRNAISELNKDIQDKLSDQVAMQNFALATNKGSAKNAGVSLGAIIAQNMRRGDFTENQLDNTLSKLNKNIENARKRGSDFASAQELFDTRKAARGEQGLSSTTLGVGVGVAALVGGLLLSPLTGGVSLAAGSMIAAGAGVGAGYAANTAETAYAQSRIQQAEEDGMLGAEGYKALDELFQAGVLTENQFNYLSAAFEKGQISMADLAKEVEGSIKQFKDIQESSDILAQQTFNLAKEFSTTISALRKNAEIEKIRGESRLKNDKANLDFSSRFRNINQTSQTKVSNQNLNLNQRNIGMQIRSFQGDQSAQLLEQTKISLDKISQTPNQTLATIRSIRENGVSDFESQVESGRLKNQVDIFGGLDTEEARKNRLKTVEKALIEGRELLKSDDISEQAEGEKMLKTKVGTSNREGLNALSKIIEERRDEIIAGNELGSITFDQDISNQEQQVFRDILKKLRDKSDIYAEQIQALKKETILTEARNIINAKIQSDLQLFQAKNQGAEISDSRSFANIRASSERRVAGLEFEKSSIFRGTRTEEQENERQFSIQQKIISEQERLQKQEVVMRMKSELRRLNSEQALINSLNKLPQNIEEALNRVSGKDVSGSGAAANPTITKQSLNEKKEEELREKQKKNSSEIDIAKNVMTDRKASLSDAQRRLKQFTPRKIKSPVGYFGKQPEEIPVDTLSLLPSLTDLNKFKQSKKSYSVNWGSMNYGGSTNEPRDPEQINEDLNKVLNDNLSTKDKELSSLKQINDSDKSTQEKNKQLLALIKKIHDDAENTVDTRRKSITEQGNTLEKLDKQKQEIAKSLVALQKSAETVSGELPKVEAMLGDITHINIKDTNTLLDKISEISIQAGSVEPVEAKLNEMKAKLQQAEGDNSIGIQNIENTIEVLNANKDAITNLVNSNNLKTFQATMTKFYKSVQGLEESMGAVQQLNEIDNTNVRSQGSLLAIRRRLEQRKKEQNLKILESDPTATRADITSARISANRQQIGTNQQEKSFKEQMDKAQFHIDEARRLKMDYGYGEDNKLVKKELTEAKDAKERADIIASQMKRTTARDGGFINEFKQNFGDGLDDGFAQLDLQSESIYTKLGQDLPFAFRNGMVDAMQAALNGADDLSGKLAQIGISFLQTIQRAFLESAAGRVVSAIGLNSGGMVTGGSGVKDDIPAMLTGGEYVIKKSAVDKYGISFMNQINNGYAQGFSKGGAVGLNVGAPRAAEREAYEDDDDDKKYGSITRYRTTKGEIGINSNLSSYARANDRKIQKYFNEQERNFRQDLTTKEQEKNRKENKERAKKAQKNALIGTALGIAGSIGINKGMDWYKGTDFAKNRAAKSASREFKKDYKDGTYDYRQGRAGFQQTRAERMGIRKDIDYFKKQGWSADQMSSYLRELNVQHRITGNDSDYEVSYNKGGRVPAKLNSGEYVMKPQAVTAYGTSMMRDINNGSLNAPKSSESSINNSNHNVGININVNNSGSSETSNPLQTKEFASKVKSAVINVINQEKRVGGSLRSAL